MRQRSTDLRLPNAPIVMDYQDDWGTVYHLVRPVNGTHGSIKTITDENHPGYRRRISRGEVIIGPMTLDRTERICESLSLTWPSPNNYRGISQSGDTTQYLEQRGVTVGTWMGPANLQSTLERYRSIALVNAYAKIHESAILSGEILNDLGQTIGMLRHPFAQSLKLLKRMLKHAEKRKGKTARTASLAISNAWLEYRYGWRPTLMDIDQIIGTSLKLYERGYRKSRRLVARGLVKLDYNNSASYDVYTPLGLFSSQKWTAVTSQRHRVAAGVIFDLQGQNTADALVASLGLRPRDVPATLWEIIPFSFVADWFIGVGNWLQAIVPAPNVAVRGAWTTVTSRSENRIISASGSFRRPCPPYDTLTGPIPDSVVYLDHVDRRMETELPTSPVILGQIPSITNAVDGLSLTVQRIFSSLERMRH